MSNISAAVVPTGTGLPTMSGALQPDCSAEEEGRDTDSAVTTNDAITKSKNQLKKLRKRQEWEATKDARKIVRKEKQKARREKIREQRNQLRAEGNVDAKMIPSISRHRRPRKDAKQLPITFVFDCSWDDLMMEKEIVSLTAQLTRCYSDNQKAAYRAHLAISSFDKRLKSRFENALRRTHESWRGVRFREADFATVVEEAKHWMRCENDGGDYCGPFEGRDGEQAEHEAEIIYLSSDSDNSLTELRPNSVYVIGGLVDKNRHKAVCYKKACEQGIKTAKLPIGDYMEMSSRKTLTVNHVNEIMLQWLSCGDWAIAFDSVIPKRKGGVPRDQRWPDGNESSPCRSGSTSFEDGAFQHDDRGGRDVADNAGNVERDEAVSLKS